MSMEFGPRTRKLVAGGAALACAASLAGGFARSSAAKTVELGNQCGKYYFDPKYKNHEYEVCNAYLLNDVGFNQPESPLPLGALTPLYTFGREVNSSGEQSLRSKYFTHHFETRYWLSARKEIETRVAQFPQGSYFADNIVTINSLVASLKTNRAIIHSTESWVVANVERGTVYQEKNQPHESTLCRIKEVYILDTPAKNIKIPHLLHEWVVVANKALPTFNCNWFARQVANGKLK